MARQSLTARERDGLREQTRLLAARRGKIRDEFDALLVQTRAGLEQGWALHDRLRVLIRNAATLSDK
jgi:hypothetical protein